MPFGAPGVRAVLDVRRRGGRGNSRPCRRWSSLQGRSDQADGEHDGRESRTKHGIILAAARMCVKLAPGNTSSGQRAFEIFITVMREAPET